MAIGLRHDRATLIPYDDHSDALAALLNVL